MIGKTTLLQPALPATSQAMQLRSLSFQKGRKRVHACILAKNEEAIENLREKGKINCVAKKKKSRKTTKKRPQEPSSSEDEDNPELVLDDSSEYSDEADGEAEDQPYPFVLKEAEIGDFILVELELEEGRNAGEKVHYVGKIFSIKDDTSYNVSFLRIKSKFGIPDNLFPSNRGHNKGVQRILQRGLSSLSSLLLDSSMNSLDLNPDPEPALLGDTVVAAATTFLEDFFAGDDDWPLSEALYSFIAFSYSSLALAAFTSHS
ncbi:hypothetical protein E2C01_020227 [Portunus trituberculatus]|uniref:Uncharacterized protein n=1 Tax=Portunus trituberculatus TaxID=210409 RepID=A0A5B7DZ87_PORTR|nr:hypothetical protein [Portunus trituberculatus]